MADTWGMATFSFVVTIETDDDDPHAIDNHPRSISDALAYYYSSKRDQKHNRWDVKRASNELAEVSQP